jgi:hypothetical protein
MRSIRCVPAVLVLSALAVALAACSSSSSSGTTTSPPSTTKLASGGGTTPTTATTSGATFTTCPTAAVVSAALGSTYPAPQTSTASGDLSCSYDDPNTSANAVLGFAKTPGLTAAVLKSTADSQASAQGASVSPLSGLGDGAYIFTLKDGGTNSSGVATTILIIQSGSTLVDITAQASPAQVDALGHVLVP